MSALRSIKWPYAVIAILAVTAASFGLLRPQLTTASASAKKNPGATERIKENPPPTLFTDAAITPLGTQVTAQHKKADDLFARWKAQHGTTRDDKAFAAWAARQIPAPPSAKARTAELHQVQQLAKTRTAPGKKAATWLELYGKKDIWKLYQHDQRELIPAAQGTAEKAQLKSALKVAKTISDQLAARDKQPAPFILDPTLRPDKHIKAGAKGPYSYPSRHAARAAAAVTVLSSLAPHRAADYRWMQDEVVYSRVYMAGHVPSDILAGTLLGDLIGDYEIAVSGS
ncbi:phosphatase PAP2 family protein [Streptomyces sp. NBC_01340]|uniref:phosphatase PAP2 family protein n=1 Tax=unclassified Streptomyces TaxID=2593676 RepID=UPI00225852C3|nr:MULTISPECIES: phosphatase PAP2 family protein [unclassified Streptomyces]MCX4457848.1 phosphatase PAP2 family protein [Streptomyces sp. NBC_01719]MCX4497205.1 phosphatase PAP2 family protein [Streptomyces sp. NBC_01728]WSI42064.1 phosphatase PAP2 family protein [Streptomyces sp. NBC_01340]